MNRQQAEQQMLVWKLEHGPLPAVLLGRTKWLRATGIYDSSSIQDQQIIRWFYSKYPKRSLFAVALLEEQDIIEYLVDTR